MELRSCGVLNIGLGVFPVSQVISRCEDGVDEIQQGR
jgi:hypothetical protein